MTGIHLPSPSGVVGYFKCISRVQGALLGLLMAVGTVHAAEQNKITALSVSDSGSGNTVIKVELSEPMSNPPAGFAINTPPRIALDFPNTENALGRTAQEFSMGDLRSANIVQAGARTRLVVNLNQMLAYETKTEGSSVLITLHAKPATQTAVADTSRFADERKGAQKHTLSELDFRRGKNGEARIEVDLSDPGVGIDIHRQGTKLVVDFLKTNLPRKLQRKLDVIDFATPVQTVDTFAQGDNIHMVIEPKGMWEHAAYQTDNKFIIEVKPVVEDVEKQVKVGYVGEKLTLNFQGISVREALNVIADFTELNMVISDSVTGNLTLRLKDVPWDQALDIILKSRGLAMRKNGNVIQVAPMGELAATEKNDLTARQEISELEELRTESFQLGYAKAADAAEILSGKGAVKSSTEQVDVTPDATAGSAKAAATAAAAKASASPSILSSRGSAMADVRTNTLFVKDIPSRLEDVRRMLKLIDVPAKQVLIEARVVEANAGFARNLGVRLGYNNSAAVPGANGGANGITGLRGGLVAIGAGGSVITPSTGNVNLPVTGGSGTFQFSLFNAAATKVLGIELTAMESDDQGKIISSPRVLSADNDKDWAVIEQGEEIPYVVGVASANSVVYTTTYKKALLRLGVKTRITPDNNVDMTVEVNKDSRGTTTGSGVAINTNKVVTKVLVENGGTVVIGGVYKQNDATIVNQVPLLGDIPVLGYLFKSKAVSTVKNELLIFLTPKILQDSLNIH
ncbi:MAG: type IV pilus secretin PilQ [Gallionella sp.]|nr:type IV pilus secretin PilQ [Gallionella sp.]